MSRSAMRAPLLLCGAVAALSAACKDGTGPGTPREPGVYVVQGGPAADSAMAAVPDLVVQVRGPDGAPLPGAVVEFRTQAHADSAFVYLSAPNTVARRAADVTTDAEGLARTPVRLAHVAGTARVFVTVPSAGYADTVTYTVRPGALAAIVVTPADTAAYVGGSYALAATTRDQWGNLRSDAVTFGSAVPQVAGVSGGRVTAAAIGRGIVTASSGNVVDSAYVSVVPQGTLAARYVGTASPHSRIWLMNLDGSALRPIPLAGAASDWGAPGQALDWSPSGTELAFAGGGGAQQLWAGTPEGAVRPLAPVPAAGRVQRSPRFSRDGQWVFYNQGDPTRNATSLWRVRANGTGAQQLTPDTPAFYTNDLDASPSPDGTRIVYGTDRARGWGISPPHRLVVMTLATREVRDLGAVGNAPRWSPVADRIVYERDRRLWVVNADGTGGRALTPGVPGYDQNVSWSPDGRWIAATRDGPFIDLINVDTGLVLPLGFSGFYTDPAWRP